MAKVKVLKYGGVSIGQLRQWLNEDRITDPKKMGMRIL